MDGIIKQGEYTYFVLPNKVFFFQDSYYSYKEYYSVKGEDVLLGPKGLVKWTE